jgi:hypothetical protein
MVEIWSANETKLRKQMSENQWNDFLLFLI